MSFPVLAVWLLGATQIVGYGTLYYSLGVLAPLMAEDFAIPVDWVYGALSVALLFGGLVSPRVGRALDNYGAGRVMTLGSLIAALALALCALAPERFSFGLGLVAMEITATFVLYEAAFALLVQITGHEAARRITHLTLIAGFASTIFWPLTSLLATHVSWREVFFIFAALHVFVCFPAHLFLSRRSNSARRPAAPPEAGAPLHSPLPIRYRRAAFILLLVGFSIAGFILSAVVVHMVPLLTALGLGAASSLVGAVFGPAQVFSRVVNMGFGKGLHPLGLALISSSLLPAALVLLVVGPAWLALAIMFAAVFGLGSGLTSIVRGTVPLAVFGAEGFGSRIGVITSARLMLSSVAPLAFALLQNTFGIAAALWALVGLGVLGVGCLLAIERMRRLSAGIVRPGQAISGAPPV